MNANLADLHTGLQNTSADTDNSRNRTPNFEPLYTLREQFMRRINNDCSKTSKRLHHRQTQICLAELNSDAMCPRVQSLQPFQQPNRQDFSMATHRKNKQLDFLHRVLAGTNVNSAEPSGVIQAESKTRVFVNFFMNPVLANSNGGCDFWLKQACSLTRKNSREFFLLKEGEFIISSQSL